MGKWKVLKRAPLTLRPSARSRAKADTQIKGLTFQFSEKYRARTSWMEMRFKKERKAANGKKKEIETFIFIFTFRFLPKHHEIRIFGRSFKKKKKKKGMGFLPIKEKPPVLL